MKIPFSSIDVQPHFLRQIKSKKIDFCFLALHGEFGEDGAIQAFLDLLQIPYTGSGAKGSGLAMDKVLTKRNFKKAGVPTPEWMTINKKEFQASGRKFLKSLQRMLKRGSVFIKPTDQGSAIGAGRVDMLPDADPALKRCFQVGEEALVERFVPGRELTVGILGKKALPVIEIVPKHSFYDFHSKYAKGGSDHLVPAPLSKALSNRAQKLSLRAFRAVSCSVYGRVDMLLDAQNGFHVLEVNTIPGMTATSLLPEAAKSAGFSFDDLVLEIVRLSLSERTRDR